MRRLFRWAVALAVVAVPVFFWLTSPKSIDPSALDGLAGDAERGRMVFYAGGCASCHAAPKAEGEDKLILAGGKSFPSPFGTFYAPNISPSGAGIGGWSDQDLANAMIHGVSPDGAHYYPAFPFTSYQRATLGDIVDLKAFLDSLPPSDVANLPHVVPFPFNIRRGLGLWKLAFLDPSPVLDPGSDAQLERGRYLVEALGHCTECHTPRNALGVTQRANWLGGAPDPSGKGRVPNITPHDTGLGGWSVDEIAYYLETGFTPEFDVAGGEMADVVLNTGELTAEDRMAMAAYLKATAPLETPK